MFGLSFRVVVQGFKERKDNASPYQLAPAAMVLYLFLLILLSCSIGMELSVALSHKNTNDATSEMESEVSSLIQFK